jgi:hypothetical protein
MYSSQESSSNGTGRADDAILHSELERVIDDITQKIDELVAVDPHDHNGADLLSTLVTLNRQQQRFSAAYAQLARAYDASKAWAETGAKSAASLLAFRCRMPAGDAKAHVRLGRALERMPEVADSLARGDVGVYHARQLARLATNRRTADAFAHDEHVLVGYAETQEWPTFYRSVIYWEQQADPDGVEQQAGSDEMLRRVHLSDGLHGTGILDGELTAIGNATVKTALERIHDEMFRDEWARLKQRLGRDPQLCELERTPAQRRHDALVEMANRAMTAPANGKRPAPLVTVLVGYETFAGRICQLADQTVVTPGTVAKLLLDDALIERVVFDGPSRVIDVGQARCFTGALRRAIEVRDRECQSPGCHVPYPHCEVDHTRPYSQGGPTTQDNGRLRCGHHNRFKGNGTGREPPDPEAQ